MKLYSLSVLYKGEAKVVLLKVGYDDVASFSFSQRSSVQEFMTFTSQLIMERSSKGTRASVAEQDYLWHVYVQNDSLAGVVITDNECPSLVAFTLLEKVLDEFSKQVNRKDWPVRSPATIHSASLDGHLSRYQNPRDADPMTKVQAEPDETQIILHNTMDSLLERGEKLGGLVSKSKVLGTGAFYKTALKQNSCCAMAQHWNSTIIRIRTAAPREEETVLHEDLEYTDNTRPTVPEAVTGWSRPTAFHGTCVLCFATVSTPPFRSTGSTLQMYITYLTPETEGKIAECQEQGSSLEHGEGPERQPWKL
ncbi:synaptobrevin homolog YKT6-like [Macaca thibetana thibetana]|uniref:synaptobrevin homolog YKT6-like n=1 Tax=Macaca thibetana thibetana TaxID=257877 RepID=UPI0021BC9B18|nr:synaptobrevin homolog YKT6-like [Macaca thibetana thibetana]